MIAPDFIENHTGLEKVTEGPFFLEEQKPFPVTVRALPPVPDKKSFGSRSVTKAVFEILWVQKGAGTLVMGKQSKQINSQSVILISPGRSFTLSPSKRMEGYSIIFPAHFPNATVTPDFDPFLSWQASEAQLPVIQLTNTVQPEIKLLIKTIVNEYENYFKSREELLAGLIKVLIIYLSRYIEFEQASPTMSLNTALTRKFMSLVEHNFFEKKMVSDYVSDLSVSSGNLNEIIKKETGFSPSYHIRHRVIMEAQRLSRSMEISMKQIAFQLGFKDPYHFSKFFKKNCGVSFTTYRRSLTTGHASNLVVTCIPAVSH